MQNFIKELSIYLEKNLSTNPGIPVANNTWNNLLADNLEIDNKKIISKYRNEMLLERANILQSYALKTKDKGEMYYIYAVNSNNSNYFNLCICESEESHQVIIKSKEELPKGVTLGSVLRKNDMDFVLDQEGTKCVGTEINRMIKEKIEEQHEYLDSKRVEGHIYEADEKYSGRIWLYDLNNKESGGIEGIEEIEITPSFYETVKKGDKFIYQNGKYQKYE